MLYMTQKKFYTKKKNHKPHISSLLYLQWNFILLELPAQSPFPTFDLNLKSTQHITLKLHTAYYEKKKQITALSTHYKPLNDK